MRNPELNLEAEFGECCKETEAAENSAFFSDSDATIFLHARKVNKFLTTGFRLGYTPAIRGERRKRRIFEVRDSHHYLFIKSQDEVVREMRR
jgi:hypothetical protein